jgi:hypothetical protein
MAVCLRDCLYQKTFRALRHARMIKCFRLVAASPCLQRHHQQVPTAQTLLLGVNNKLSMVTNAFNELLQYVQKFSYFYNKIKRKSIFVGFEVITAVGIFVQSVDSSQLFGRTCLFHLQDRRRKPSKKLT